jgi:hypothetical protein
MKWMVLIFLVASQALAVSPTSAPATKGSPTPKEAARRLTTAFAQPTKQGLRDAIAGKTPAEERAADIWAESMAAQFRLQETIREKFGDKGYASFFGHPPRPRPTTQELMKTIDAAFENAKIEEGGDEARVTPSAGPSAQQIWLMRSGDGGWKAWIGGALQARSAKLIDNYIKSYDDFARVRNQVADDIEAGNLKTPLEAKEVMGRLEDEEAMKADPASTQKTSTPEQAAAELKAQVQQMQDLEAERDRLEREAATRPVGK